MINNMKNKIKLFALCAVTVLTVSACSDWTDVESVDLNQQSPSTSNPEQYAQYLESLRNYKQANHKFVYAWFDNSEKDPFSRGQHLDAIPDSVDVVVLMSPDELAAFETTEMEEIRINKGTKTVYTVSFDAIKKQYEQMVKEETDKSESYVPPVFVNYLISETKAALVPATSYNYDGIIVGYKGASTVYMTKEEKEAYIEEQEAFLKEIATWQSANSGKMISFDGYPQNLISKDILQGCKHIILNTQHIATTSRLSIEALQASVNGVPTNRYIVVASTRSLDTTDKTTGYYDGNLRAITEAAYWTTSQENGFTKAGLGIYNIQNDYYNPTRVYQYAKEAINIMNPAPKK